jgi:phosphoglucomutase
MIDRITAKLGRRLFETPVGFKWFVDGLLDGSLGFAGEESAGSVFLRREGGIWTTDKDGFIPCLLAAESMARTGRDPATVYREFRQEFGEPAYERLDAPATTEQKDRLAGLSPQQVTVDQLAGEKIETMLTHAPGNGAPIGGLKVTTEHGWFVARPSGTENIYKLYAESFRGMDHLHQIQAEAQVIINHALAAVPDTGKAGEKPLAGPHPMTVEEAKAAWRNEGDPN